MKNAAAIPEELETHDIYLAAYLLLAGCVLSRERKVGARKYFIFTNPAGSLVELRQAYYSGAAVVKVHDYAQKVIAVKNLVFT
jgi:hypothetical protein